MRAALRAEHAKLHGMPAGLEPPPVAPQAAPVARVLAPTTLAWCRVCEGPKARKDDACRWCAIDAALATVPR